MRDRVTSLTINNLPESLVGEVLECLREYFGTDAVEINLSDGRKRGYERQSTDPDMSGILRKTS